MTNNSNIGVDRNGILCTFEAVYLLVKSTCAYKQLLLMICLTAYAVGLFKPFATYVGYACNVDYISTKLCVQKNETNNCCKGKCYLSSQLKKEAKEESQQKVPTVKTIQEEMLAECLELSVPEQSIQIEYSRQAAGIVGRIKLISVPPPQRV
jgi:hypothetical protein